MTTSAQVLREYARWLASLAPWTHFVTLTHRLPGGGGTTGAWGRVGLQRHRRQRRRWVYEEIRRRDPRARWWSETELHDSGQPHEHGLLALTDRDADVPAMRQAWSDDCGFAVVTDIESVVAAARYVEKYHEVAVGPPLVVGFGRPTRK